MVRASGTRSSGRGARRGAKATDLEVPEAKPVDEQLPLDTQTHQDEPETVQTEVVVIAVSEDVASEPVADEPAAEAVSQPAEAEAEPAVAAAASGAEAGAGDEASSVKAEAEPAELVVIVVAAEAEDTPVAEAPAADPEPQPVEPAAVVEPVVDLEPQPEAVVASAAAEEKVAAAPAVAEEKWDGDPPSVQAEPPSAEPVQAASAPADAKPAAAATAGASGRSKRSQQAVTVASSRNLPAAVSTVPAGRASDEQKELLRVFIIDSRWNSAASKVLHENIDVLHKLMGADPLFVLDQDASVEVLRQHRQLVGRDPIISVHNVGAMAVGGEQQEHGFRLHLGLLKTEAQVLHMLQIFSNFISRYRELQNLEASVKRKLRREGMAGTLEIIMGGKDMDLMPD